MNSKQENPAFVAMDPQSTTANRSLDRTLFDLNQKPDVASGKTEQNQHTLNWVGMDGIDLPLRLAIGQDTVLSIQAKADCYVSLDDACAKGIHMSRLYLALNRYAELEVFTPAALAALLRGMLESHDGLSEQAHVRLSFPLMLKRPALLSEYEGWKAYEAEIQCQQAQDRTTVELSIRIPYSSTCPCSASLSRQLQAQALREAFGEGPILLDQVADWIQSRAGSLAPPHSQRSFAYIKVQWQPNGYSAFFPFAALVDQIEQALGTPVQTAVKREDEQEFARLNGENLMFCEDAARRIKTELLSMTNVEDFWVKVEHQESLHAHNAIAVATKGPDSRYQSGPGCVQQSEK
jgi:GTP cyclohydrolase I